MNRMNDHIIIIIFKSYCRFEINEERNNPHFSSVTDIADAEDLIP